LSEAFESWIAREASARDLAPRVYSELCAMKRHAETLILALSGLFAAVPKAVGVSGAPAAAIMAVGLGLSFSYGAARWLDADDLIRQFQEVVMKGGDPVGLPRFVRWLSRWGGLLTMATVSALVIMAGVIAYL